MPVTSVPNWSNLAGKPTTVAGLGLSDFNAQAIAAQAGASVGAVGSYFFPYDPGAAVSVNVGATVAGSALRKVNNSSSIVSAGLSGTWRSMGGREDPVALTVMFLRIA